MTSCITFENRHIWQDLFNSVVVDKPCVGRLVRITRGKHTGKIGVVEKHTQSKYIDAFRYGNDAQHAMTQARGRYGFIILVRSDNETFWCNADYAMVCVED